MMKKRSSILKPIDLFVLVFCISVAAFFLNLFWNDLNQMLSKNETPIATVSYKRNSVQRKFQEKMIWDRMQQNGPIYNGDTLHTSTDAQATIRFPDGQTLEIFENSMVKLVMDKDKAISVELSGETSRVSADTSNSQSEAAMSIISRDTGSKIQVQKGSVMTAQAASDSKEIQIQVEKGEAVITSKTGENVKADAGTTIAVNNEGKTRKPEFTMKFPPVSYLVLRQESKDSGTVRFEWQKSGSTPVRLETSFDKNFETIAGSYLFESENAKSLALPAGTVYWRARAVANQDDREFKGSSDSVSGKITVFDAKTPVLLRPEDGQKFSYRSKLPAIRLSWKGNEYAASYKLEISDSADFKNIVIAKDVEGTSQTIQELPQGKWYWKVTPFYTLNKTGSGISSASGNFEIVLSQSLAAPLPLLPRNGENAIIGKDVSFSWKSMAEAKNYDIIISKNSDLSSPVWNLNIRDNYYILNTQDFAEGTYYWAVRQNDEEGTSSAYCKPCSFKMEKTKPVLITKLVSPQDGYTCAANKTKEMTFVWTKSEEGSEFQISRSMDFETTEYSQKVLGLSLSGLSLEMGKHYWRVGNSSIHSFTVSENLEGPKLVYPSQNSEILADENQQISFSWQPVSDADFYRFVLAEKSANGSSKEILVLNKIKDNNAKVIVPSIQNSFKNYEWKVQAFKEESAASSGIRGEISSQSFKIRSPYKIDNAYPQDKTTIAGLTALLEQTKFSWTSKDIAAKQIFILEKEDFSAKTGKTIRQTVRTIANSAGSVSITGLNSGKYYWHIQASSTGGTDMSSEEWSFTVDPVPPLAKPILGSPVDKTVFGAAYLRTSRTINFDWQSVPYANEYKFILKRTDSKVPLIEKKLKKLNYSVEVSDLDLASFEWSVQAFRKQGESAIIQTGDASKATFKIEIPMPQEIKALDQGVQYGE